MLNLKSLVIILFIVITSIVAGLASIVFSGLSNGSYVALLGLPVLMILTMLFIFNRDLLFLLIIISRVSLDPFIVKSKMGALGLGLVLNVIIILMAIMSFKTLPIKLKKLLKDSWLVFFVVLIFALIFSTDFVNSLKIFVNIIACGAIFTIALSLIKNEQNYTKWLKVVLISSLIPIGYALSEKIMGSAQYFGSEGFRLQGTFFHPNVLGFYSVLIISVCLIIFKIDLKVVNGFVKKSLPLYILLIFTVLLFTKTRSAWAACFVFMFLYGLIFERKYLVYMMVVMAMALLVPEIQDRLINLQQGEAVWGHGQLNSYSWRTTIWKDGLSWMSPQRYFFGYGLDSFIKHSVTFFSLGGGGHAGAHNVYVQLLFETGGLGLAAYLLMNFVLLKNSIKYLRVHALLSFMLISLIIEYGLFAYSDNMFAYISFNWSYWFVLGITIAYLELKSKTDETDVKNNSNAVSATIKNKH